MGATRRRLYLVSSSLDDLWSRYESCAGRVTETPKSHRDALFELSRFGPKRLDRAHLAHSVSKMCMIAEVSTSTHDSTLDAGRRKVSSVGWGVSCGVVERSASSSLSATARALDVATYASDSCFLPNMAFSLASQVSALYAVLMRVRVRASLRAHERERE